MHLVQSCSPDLRAQVQARMRATMPVASQDDQGDVAMDEDEDEDEVDVEPQHLPIVSSGGTRARREKPLSDKMTHSTD